DVGADRLPAPTAISRLEQDIRSGVHHARRGAGEYDRGDPTPAIGGVRPDAARDTRGPAPWRAFAGRIVGLEACLGTTHARLRGLPLHVREAETLNAVCGGRAVHFGERVIRIAWIHDEIHTIATTHLKRVPIRDPAAIPHGTRDAPAPVVLQAAAHHEWVARVHPHLPELLEGNVRLPFPRVSAIPRDSKSSVVR